MAYFLLEVHFRDGRYALAVWETKGGAAHCIDASAEVIWMRGGLLSREATKQRLLQENAFWRWIRADEVRMI
jgi:hypothetical protein